MAIVPGVMNTISAPEPRDEEPLLSAHRELASDRDEPTVDVRPARDDEVDELAGIHVRAWQHAYRGLLPQSLLDGLSVSARASSWRRVLADGGRVFVAVEDDEVRGFVSHGPSRDGDAGPTTGELYAVYVDPDHQSRGIGRRLTAACRGDLAGTFREATLWMLRDNAPARRFYESHGWSPDGATRTEQMGIEDDLHTVEEIRERTELWRSGTALGDLNAGDEDVT